MKRPKRLSMKSCNIASEVFIDGDTAICAFEATLANTRKTTDTNNFLHILKNLEAIKSISPLVEIDSFDS
jgi:hypothetical protein